MENKTLETNEIEAKLEMGIFSQELFSSDIKKKKELPEGRVKPFIIFTYSKDVATQGALNLYAKNYAEYYETVSDTDNLFAAYSKEKFFWSVSRRSFKTEIDLEEWCEEKGYAKAVFSEDEPDYVEDYAFESEDVQFNAAIEYASTVYKEWDTESEFRYALVD